MGFNDFILNCEKENEELKKNIEYYKNKSKRLERENQQQKDQLKQRDEVIEETIKHVKSLSSKGRDCVIYTDVKKDILDKLQKYKGDNK